ncbi:MAG: glycosyltransferase family 2 protein [Chloroflexi bacterium]|nr:glycosyltransferase family 2 protein [Chloroflexota bacterium]
MANVDLVIPVYNEEAILEQSVVTTLDFLDHHPEHRWRLVIANNASTDRTLEVARQLEARFPSHVVAQHIPVKGRGIALRTAWLTSDADVMAYMDVDLSTDLQHIRELIDPIADGRYDLSYGTRLHPRSQTRRGWKREITSRAYVFLLRYAARLRVTDAQCGFKAIGREAARALVPLVKDTGWFFDSELLLIAQENGYRLLEIPVRWIEDRDSRVRVLHTAVEDVKGIWRMRRGGIPRPAPGDGGPDA